MAFDPETSFFTADLHLGHTNMTGAGENFCDSPFKSIEERQEEMLKRWNAKVPKGGVVFVLGDVGRLAYITDFLDRANGTAHLIQGNHDERISFDRMRKAGFVRCDIRRTVNVVDPEGAFQTKKGPNVQEIVCDHYPMRTWKKKHYGAWHLFGHVHGNMESYDKSFDVGVDCWDYAPLSYAEVKKVMAPLLAHGTKFKEVRKGV